MTAKGSTPQHADVNAEWRALRLLYPLYCALARECVIDVTPCGDLEHETDNPTDESLQAGRLWFSQMDEIVQVHQLRHFLQTSTLANDEILRALLLHHLRKQQHNDSDRNKTDFLLVQLFSLCASPHLTDSEIDLANVAQILEPVTGAFELDLPDWLKPLEEITQRAQSCKSLKELFTCRNIEQGRKLKESCGDNYFAPIAMAAFTRSGFLLRRVFFRLMHEDLSAILDGLRELESRGVESLDCRKAQFSAYEPMARLRMICQSWKVMFHAEYSSGQPLCLLVDLRTVVDAALAKTASRIQPGGRSPDTVKSFAATAGAAGAAERPDSSNTFREWNRESSSSASETPNEKENNADLD